MQRRLERLADAEYDLLIIGGGITGAFVAHDAILRGLRVALVEKNDFGAYTSSASSKLLHGGIRYLPKGQVWKVRETYRETFGDLSAMPTVPYLYGLVPGEEIAVQLDKGITLIFDLEAISEADKKGKQKKVLRA